MTTTCQSGVSTPIRLNSTMPTTSSTTPATGKTL